MNRPFLILSLGAFALRALCAWVDYYHPLFPAYYYNDANIYDALAWKSVLYWQDQGPRPDWHPSYLVYQNILAFLYSILGHKVLLARLFNAGLGAFTVFVVAKISARITTQRGGLLTGALYALWPSCIFFNSQLLKDNVVLALAFSALWALSVALSRQQRGEATTAPLALSLVLLLAGALMRFHVMLVVAIAFGLSQGIVWLERRNIRLSTAIQTVVFLSSFLVVRTFAAGLIFAPPPDIKTSGEQTKLYASSVDIQAREISPQSLTEFRKLIQFSADRRGRIVQTKILPNKEFKTWLDVALFLPQGFFYAAFMPLPGLYPINGKIGRLMASLENLVLLTLCLLGIFALFRERKSSDHWILLLSFVGLSIVSALFELDLGSAARHKLQYLPLLFLFAAPFLLRTLEPGWAAVTRWFGQTRAAETEQDKETKQG